jgi:RNA polymerase sigma-70 factor (ECF subfamily)
MEGAFHLQLTAIRGPMHPETPGDDPSSESPLESTARLLAHARAGNTAARDRLFERYLPILTRWAHRRLPWGARDLNDTDDLVQTTLLRALSNLDSFEARAEGAFLAYLRQILLNSVRDDIRRATRRRLPGTLDEEHPDPSPSPFEQMLTRETLERYEAALSALTEEQRQAVILRVEMGLSHREIAGALGRSSADAARMVVARALVRMAELMHEPE